MKKSASTTGFTLLELLIVIAIMAVLFTLISSGLRSAKQSANMAKEVNSARQLMGAFLAYAGANDGEFLPGYGDFAAKDETGEDLHSPVCARYPWRLAPYFSYDMRLLYGAGDDDLSRLSKTNRQDYVYRVSVQPALGMNTVFVGGDYQTLDPTAPKVLSRYGQFCVTRLSQASNASRLVVFASAAGVNAGSKLTGYFKVQSPYLNSRTWVADYNAKLGAESYGNVDFRYDEKAVAAMLDGHVELLNFAQLSDMRRWSSRAAETDNAVWTLGK